MSKCRVSKNAKIKFLFKIQKTILKLESAIRNVNWLKLFLSNSAACHVQLICNGIGLFCLRANAFSTNANAFFTNDNAFLLTLFSSSLIYSITQFPAQPGKNVSVSEKREKSINTFFIPNHRVFVNTFFIKELFVNALCR